MRRPTSQPAAIAAFVALMSLISLSAHAHKASDSYLTLDLRDEPPTLRWDIAVRDVEYAVGLDRDQDRAITWRELRTRHAEIAAWALSNIAISRDGAACTSSVVRQQVARHSDGAYTVLEAALECARSGAVSLDYRLLFDLDPLHRGLLRVQLPDDVRSFVLSPETRHVSIDAARSARWRQFTDYWREGVWHIWLGFDHLLFLVTLLLPAVIRRESGSDRALGSIRPALLDVLGVVTAFTVAHSVTLAASVLGTIALPSHAVEAAIAATVIVAALNNLYPLLSARRWLIAFLLGLIHGFGFAGALSDLGLPDGALALALLGFNVGVESGQLVVAALFVPIAFALRETWFYRRVVLGFGSIAVASIGFLWLTQRI